MKVKIIIGWILVIVSAIVLHVSIEFVYRGGMYSEEDCNNIVEAVENAKVVDCEGLRLPSGESIWENTYSWVNPFSKYYVLGGKLIPRKYNKIIEAKIESCKPKEPFKV